MRKEQFEKRIILGDIHGRTDIFNKIYEAEKPVDTTMYSVILLGDYLDTHENISPEDQVNGLRYLLDVQKMHTKTYGNFIMLIGNHDFHYLCQDPDEIYSGYNPKTNIMAYPILKDAVARHKIKFAEVDMKNRTIYSHAGVTNTWINHREKVSIPINLIDVASIDNFKFTWGIILTLMEMIH